MRLPEAVRQVVAIRNVASFEERVHDPEDFVAEVAEASLATVLGLGVQNVVVDFLRIFIELIHALLVESGLVCGHRALALVLLLLFQDLLHLDEDVADDQSRLVFEAEEGRDEMVLLAEDLQLRSILQLPQLLIDFQLLDYFLKAL